MLLSILQARDYLPLGPGGGALVESSTSLSRVCDPECRVRTLPSSCGAGALSGVLSRTSLLSCSE